MPWLSHPPGGKSQLLGVRVPAGAPGVVPEYGALHLKPNTSAALREWTNLLTAPSNTLCQGAKPRRGMGGPPSCLPPHLGGTGLSGSPTFAAVPRRTQALRGHCCCEDENQRYGAAANPSPFPSRRKGSTVSQHLGVPGDGELSQGCWSAWRCQAMDCVSLKLAFPKVRVMQTPSTVRGGAFAL